MPFLQTLMLLAAAGAGAAAKAPAPDGVPPDVLKAVQGKLPKGWTATARGAALTVRREKKVGLWNPVGAPPRLDDKPPTATATETYEITLGFRPLIKSEEYEKLRKENEESGKKLEAMRAELRAAKIAHKFDDWLPDTPEQKKLLAAYRAAQKAMPFHRLPDLYDRTHSIDLEDSIRFPLTFTSPDDAKECEQVKDSIRRLFSRYEDQ
jgi:hypothetical protein